MSAPVSIVLPCLDRRPLLQANLPPLLDELRRRDADDEVIVVDDSGSGSLAPWVATTFPGVNTVVQAENGGFARALLAGVAEARHELVFSMNSDVRVHAGFLEPLVAALQDTDVFACVPRVLLGGEETEIESLTELRLKDGFVDIRQPGLEGGGRRQPSRPVPVGFAVGGTMLLRKAEFLAQDGFDPLYLPFYWEDVDLCWQAWRAGRRVVYEARSTVEHHHRGTIGEVASSELVRAAIEKNRLLFHWKNLDDGPELREHVLGLYRLAVDAYLADQRDELVWLNLALEQLEEAAEARGKRPKPKRSPAQILDESRPHPEGF